MPALRWLSGEKPNINKVRDALSQIVAAGHRASEVIISIRAMFKKESVEEIPVDINDLDRNRLAAHADRPGETPRRTRPSDQRAVAPRASATRAIAAAIRIW